MKTTGFLTPLIVEAHDDGKTWNLIEPLVFRGTQGDDFIVEAGEETDFATVPWWTQAILPRTGTWSRAAVVHDKMCNELNAWWRKVQFHLSTELSLDQALIAAGPAPRFNAVDTDAIFRKNAREGGTDPIRSELLWMGVRWGALANPARRSGWLSTAPRVLLDTLAALVTLAVLAALVAKVVPW